MSVFFGLHIYGKLEKSLYVVGWRKEVSLNYLSRAAPSRVIWFWDELWQSFFALAVATCSAIKTFSNLSASLPMAGNFKFFTATGWSSDREREREREGGEGERKEGVGKRVEKKWKWCLERRKEYSL